MPIRLIQPCVSALAGEFERPLELWAGARAFQLRDSGYKPFGDKRVRSLRCVGAQRPLQVLRRDRSGLPRQVLQHSRRLGGKRVIVEGAGVQRLVGHQDALPKTGRHHQLRAAKEGGKVVVGEPLRQVTARLTQHGLRFYGRVERLYFGECSGVREAEDNALGKLRAAPEGHPDRLAAADFHVGGML